MHVEIDFTLRGGITDEADDFQGVKDIRVLLLAIHHHLDVRLVVRRQDSYRDPGGGGGIKIVKYRGTDLNPSSMKESCEMLSTTIRVEVTSI